MDRITLDPRIMLGKPVITGTRITVEMILEKLAAGFGVAAVLEDYPPLTREDVLAALADRCRTRGSGRRLSLHSEGR